MNLMRFLVPALLVALVNPLLGQPATFQHTVRYGSTSYVASFVQHSARGPNFAVAVQQANGQFLTHTPGPVRTYLGSIASLPGAMASAVRRADGSILYHVLFEDGAEWIHDGSATTLRTDATWTPNDPELVTGTGGSGSRVFAAEVGVDLPYSQYVVDGNVDAALEMIEHSVNTVNLIYLRDACLMHRLGRVVVRADQARDPYLGMTTTNALLSEVTSQWNGVLSPSTHDIALVATSATGGGLASVGVVGTPGYSANGATRAGDFTIVWRHEAGHNWSMGHYDGGTPEGRTINSGNTLSRMSGAEQAKTIAHRNARLAHLDDLGPYPLSIPPRASLDRATFLPGGASLALDVLDNDHDANGDALRIVAFDGTTRSGGTVTRSPGTGPGGRDELVYTPPALLSSSTDHFTYRIADGTGRESLGNVMTKLTSDADLLAHFAMETGSGSAARDSSSYVRSAAFDGGPTWTTGRFGRGIQFDGVDDRLLAPALDRTTAALTITGWVKRDGSQAAWAGLVFCRGGTTTVGFNFGTHDELRYHWDGGQYGWDSGLVVPDGVWTFVALTVRPNAATIFMDAGSGLQFANHSGTHRAQAFDATLTIGRDPNSSTRSFHGSLDEIRVYDRSLSLGELQDLANGFGSAAHPLPESLSQHNQSSMNLSWTPSPGAVAHRVFFSSVYVDVRNGSPSADRGTLGGFTWTTPLLGNGTWFWRVDSTNGQRWVEGPVWAFTITTGFTPALVQTYGVGCAGASGQVPAMGAIGRPAVGTTTFALDVTRGAPNALASLSLSTYAGDLPIGPCHLLLALPFMPLVVIPTDSTGRAQFPLPIPLNGALYGLRLFGQAAILDAGGALLGVASMSDGVHMTIGY